jgi:hypothetical protein
VKIVSCFLIELARVATMQRHNRETMSETTPHTVTIAKRRFELRRDSVESATDRVLPEPIATHYVVIGARRYPPKQVIGLVTGLDRADFTSHQARRVLMGLGFAVGRRRDAAEPANRGDAYPRSARRLAERADATADPEADRDRRLAEMLRAFRGEWVATKDGELLVAAPTPTELVGWLARHDRRADSMFRVPEDEIALAGLAPL